LRGKNRNALERIECEQVSISGDHVGCDATHSQFDKLIVLRITTGSYLHIDIDPVSLSRQSRQKTSNVVLIEISTEALSVQNLVQFGECSERKQHFSPLQRQVDGMARFRIR
jgi:hypothetical protein